MSLSLRWKKSPAWAVLCLAAAAGSAAGNPGREPARTRRTEAAVDLPDLLRKAAAYCRKLEGSVLDFIAIEEIEEITD